MKKVLFATTALVASAGFASAEVALTGSAEMGIVGGSGMDTQFHNDIDVKFTLSGSTDNGLTFGATIDLDEVDAAGNGIPAGSNPSSVFISGSFGTLTMGDTDGAFDWALQEVGIGSAIADDHTSHAGFSGNSGLDGTHDGQIVRYDYSFGEFAFAVSAELDDSGTGDAVFGLGGKYSGDLGGVTLGIGLGYQTNGMRDIYGLSIDAKFAGGFRGIINYSDLDTDTHMGIGVGYSANGLTVSANYGEYDSGASGWGLAANYDLGGGAVLQAGYGSSDPAGTNTFSLGVAMSF